MPHVVHVADFDKPVVPLSLGRFGVIAEIKHRSPAEGPLQDGTDTDLSRAHSLIRGVRGAPLSPC